MFGHSFRISPTKPKLTFAISELDIQQIHRGKGEKELTFSGGKHSWYCS